NRKAAVGQFREEGLDVAEARAARCRIARMANRAATVKALDNGWLCEVVADQADVPLDKELAAIEGNDTGRFLTSVLERMETQGHDCGCVLAAKNAEDATFVVKVVVSFVRKNAFISHCWRASCKICSVCAAALPAVSYLWRHRPPSEA